MEGINIRDLIFGFCRLGNFIVIKSQPKESLDNFDFRMLSKMETNYSELNKEVLNKISDQSLTKFGDFFYRVPLVMRDNRSIRHLIQIVPIEQDNIKYFSHDVHNRLFVDKNDTIYNYCDIIISDNLLNLDMGTSEEGINSFISMSMMLVDGLLKVITNNPKAIEDPDIYKLYMILYPVFAKKLLSGSKLISFDGTPYPDYCQILYDEFNKFDPNHLFNTPTEQDVNNLIAIICDMI